MKLLPCPYLGHDVELTDEREGHIRDKHPDLWRDYGHLIDETVRVPDRVLRTSRDADTRLFIRRFDSEISGKNVVVVVVTHTEPRERHWVVTAYLANRVTTRRNRMAATLSISYDHVGDILYLERVKPYAEQESDEIGDGIIARFHPKTGDVESLEILWFSKRTADDDLLELPIVTEMRLQERVA